MRKESNITTTWSICCWRIRSPLLWLCITGIYLRWELTSLCLSSSGLLIGRCCSMNTDVVLTLHLFRCYRRNMAAGRTSAWWTTSMTLPTCASRDSGTEWSTGSPSTTPGWVGGQEKKRCIHRSPVSVCCVDQTVLCCIFQSIAVEGYETGEHAPGLKLRGTGAYKAAHHIIKVRLDTLEFVLYRHQTTNNRP